MHRLGRVLLLVATVLACSVCRTAAMTNQDVYPGLRRPPAAKISAAAPSNAYDENYLSQILNYIEEQARRKFQEKLKNYQIKSVNEELADNWEDSIDRDYSYKMPPNTDGGPQSLDVPVDFAVGPNDPRFYENSKSVQPARENPPFYDTDSMETLDAVSSGGQGPYMRIKDPLVVNPKPDPNSFLKSQQMQGLLHKWGRNNNNNVGARIVPPPVGQGPEVVQRPVLEQTSISLYGVALIAGVSAAITIALIALGVAWWTFYKKSKAAQDVEYPAYGVTGPNKEKLSPTSGDRRLAQNAQMYHYQHQKQQIIAMENKMNEDRNGSLSDAGHSDDEEGDYTVYECPGLAPTGGEMEVKNPLFFDDPTPATPTPGNGNAAKAPQKPTAPSAGAVKKNHK